MCWYFLAGFFVKKNYFWSVKTYYQLAFADSQQLFQPLDRIKLHSDLLFEVLCINGGETLLLPYELINLFFRSTSHLAICPRST